MLQQSGRHRGGPGRPSLARLIERECKAARAHGLSSRDYRIRVPTRSPIHEGECKVARALCLSSRGYGIRVPAPSPVNASVVEQQTR